MRGRDRITGGGASGRAIFHAVAGAPAPAFALLAAVSASAQAQPVWSLPPAETSSPTPAPQGPVDPQNPVVTPSPAPASSEPVPVIAAPPPPAPSASASAPAPASSAAPPRRETPAPRASASPAPATEPAEAAPASPAPAPSPLADNAETAAAAPPPATPASSSAWPAWWWLALPAALLALGWLLARRRGGGPDAEPEPVPQSHAAAEPPASLKAGPEAGAAPPIPAPAVSAPPASPARASGALDFAPVSLRISLVYATLRFRLVLTAGTAFPAGRLLADMISAHGSLPQDQQLAPPVEALAALAETPALEPGQAIEIEGELQLPLASVRPLRQGDATFLVPLVRLAWLGDNAPGVPHLELGCAFTVGVHGQGPALAPLRLDTGPRDFTGLSAREIDAARRTALLPLDPTRAAG